MKRALLVSPYFAPSNLAGAQRARIIASRLAEFGWEPIVIAVDPAEYEEECDSASLSLLPAHLRVERVAAFPKWMSRRLGLGDLGLRAQFTMRRKVGELVRQGEADVIFATVLSGYTSLVGAWAKRTFRLPFVLDYQDPWVSNTGALSPRLSKAGLSHSIAAQLEPSAVRASDAITAVSDETLATLRQRHLLGPKHPVEIIPIGADISDHVAAARVGRSWIQRTDKDFVIAYTGTITEGMLPSVRTMFRAVRLLMDSNPGRAPCLHFIGTSAQPNGGDTHRLQEIARELGISKVFRLEPRRIGYLDTLRTMGDADVLLLIGSHEPHYTASKIFPCWLSGKPIFALFHAASTVNELARELGGIDVVTYETGVEGERKVDDAFKALRTLMQYGLAALAPRNDVAFEPYSARGVARSYAALFDRILEGRLCASASPG